MSWEDIIKRPFDATAARRNTNEPTRKRGIAKKYLDPYVRVALEGGRAKYNQWELEYRDKSYANKIKKDEDDGYSYAAHYARRNRSPKKIRSSDYEVNIPTKDWERFPERARDVIEGLTDAELEQFYNIDVVSRIPRGNGFSFQFKLR
tara:strand:+ start:6921 stop:7364 length:444 start_codon:yes stop_codon:yes gene_type:complete